VEDFITTFNDKKSIRAAGRDKPWTVDVVNKLLAQMKKFDDLPEHVTWANGKLFGGPLKEVNGESSGDEEGESEDSV